MQAVCGSTTVTHFVIFSTALGGANLTFLWLTNLFDFPQQFQAPGRYYKVCLLLHGKYIMSLTNSTPVVLFRKIMDTAWQTYEKQKVL
jgi:hypothetical protein